MTWVTILVSIEYGQHKKTRHLSIWMVAGQSYFIVEVAGDRIELANSQGEQSPRFWVHSVRDDFRALSSWCGGSGGNHRN
jgi:hypothetical protein